MASTHKHLRSSTANKRPTTAIADGQIALNTNTTSPGLFFKDSTGATIIKVGPVHVGSSAPNASPPAGGSSGNSTGEIWLDTSLTPNGVKIWNGASWTNATPIGSTTVQGLLELATNAETQTGTDPDRAVTPAGLQSKVSDSTSTTSSTTIASSTAVKSAYDLANAALPKTGGTVTGNLEIGTTGSLSFEGATADAFETTIAVVDPTADRTITLPDTTGTIVTTGDTGTVTSTMIADGTIVNGDVNASAAIEHSKLANITAGSVLLGNASNVPTATALSGDVTVNSTGVTAISSGVIVNADVNASAAIAGTKISPDFGSQTVQTTGIVSHALGTAGAPTVTFTGDTNTGIYSPGADQVAISTGGSGRVFIGSTGTVNFTGAGTAGSTQAVSFNGSAPVNSLVIDSSGRLGVGTSSPVYLVDVQGGRSLFTANSETYSVGVRNRASLAPNGNFWIGATNSTTPDMVFSNNTGTERMRITDTGLVGIGSSNPQTLLHLSNTAQQRFNCLSTANAISFWKDGTPTFAAEIGIGGATGITSTMKFDIYNGSAWNTAMTIDSSSRVGIGVTSPGNFVGNVNVVVGSAATSTTTAAVTCYSGTATYGGLYFADGTVGDQLYRGYVEYKHDVDALALGSGGLERARIDSSGNILKQYGTALQSYTSGGSVSHMMSYGSWNGTGNLLVVGNTFDGIVFGTGGGTMTEKARFDASGRLLVGTSSAFSAGASAQYGKFQLTGNTFSASTQAIIALGRGQAAGASITSGAAIGTLVFSDNTGGEFAQIACEADAATGTNDYPGRLVFSVTRDGESSPTGRFWIVNNGYSYFQSTGQGVAFATTQGAGTTTEVISAGHSATGGTYNSITTSFKVWSNGNVQNTNNSYTAISDIKLKENIVDANSQWDDIKALQVRNYNLKEGQTHKQIGLIAQEVEPISPGLVYESPDRDAEGNDLGTVTKSVNYSVLYMKAVKALQEAMERIEQLEAKVAALEAA